MRLNYCDKKIIDDIVIVRVETENCKIKEEI
jgi:hypothetical protein